MQTYQLTVRDVTENNRLKKYAAATSSLAKAMGVRLKNSSEELEDDTTEDFLFQSEADLSDKWNLFFSECTKDLYLTVTNALDLPRVTTTVKKAVPNPLIWRGKIVYHPETGKPIKRGDWDRLVAAMERFLNRKLDGAEKKIVLESKSLAKLLNKLLQHQGSPEKALSELRLSDFVKKERSWGAYTEILSNYVKKFGATQEESNQVYLAIDRLGTHITDLKARALKEIKLTVSEGIQARKGKQAIAQDLFDRLGHLNKDWRRVVEYEIADCFGNAWLRAEVDKAEPGKKLYFRRLEAFDGKVCRACQDIQNKVVLWSDVALASEKIEDSHTDTAIWEGKSNIGRKRRDWWVTAGPMHPHCRGIWVSYVPSTGDEDLTGEGTKKLAAKLKSERQLREKIFQEMKSNGWRPQHRGYTQEFRQRSQEEGIL